MKRRVELPRPQTAYDTRPELHVLKDDGAIHLVHLPFVVSSPVCRHGYSVVTKRYECETRHTIYSFDWAPTLRACHRTDLARLRRSLKQRVGRAT